MSVKHIGDLTKSECYGCTACSFSCPAGAITMVRDAEGFRYPSVDEEKCINCGKCRKICPGINEKEQSNLKEPECYALWADEGIRRKSASGGAFTILARYVLKQNGIVCGVVMDEGFHVFHTVAASEKEIEPMRRSKYVESDLGEIFLRVKDYLAAGKKVLFVGTPCQAAGLKAFLGKPEEGLLLVDLVCHGMTSPMVFDRYLDETFGKENVRTYYFRTKMYGYNGTTQVAVMKNGKSYVCTEDSDPFIISAVKCLDLRMTCYNCKFAEFPRQGDITIGDFWGLAAYDKELFNELGTSVVLVNNEKGRKVFEEIRADGTKVVQTPLEAAVRKNRFRPVQRLHPNRDRFFEMLQYTSMHKAVQYCIKNRYDVGLLGVWFGCNYGSIATYYGLMKQLQGLGLSVLMIDKPGFKEDPELAEENHNRVFAKSHFHVSKRYNLKDIGILNHYCDSFVIGSDQVWNYGICRNFGRSFLMDFVRDEKRKVAVAASFGHDKDFRTVREQIVTAGYLKRFDAISVREKSAVDILKKNFDVEGTRILDPVFSTDRKVYDDIAAESERREEEPYLLTYILDPTPEKREAITYLSEKLGLRALHILDGTPWNFEENKRKMDMDNILENITFQDWVYYFKNSSYVITDSCHGMSFAIIYRKPFAAIGNKRRGMTRFKSLTELFHLENRLVTDPADIIKDGRFLENIDYQPVEEILTAETEAARNWLKNAMFSEKSAKTYQSYPVRISPLEEADIQIKTEVVKQAEPSFARRVYYHLPLKMQKKIKAVVKGYVEKSNS